MSVQQEMVKYHHQQQLPFEICAVIQPGEGVTLLPKWLIEYFPTSRDERRQEGGSEGGLGEGCVVRYEAGHARPQSTPPSSLGVTGIIEGSI